MPVFTKNNFPDLLAQHKNSPSQVYLLFGERYLCQDAAARLEKMLLEPNGTVHLIDGDQEDMSTIISKLKSYSLLPGKQLFKVVDSKIFHSKNVAEKIWNQAIKAHENNNNKETVKYIRSFLNTGGLSFHNESAPLSSLSPAEWKNYFGFVKPGKDISWADQTAASLSPQKNIEKLDGAELLAASLEESLPSQHILVLITDVVDKRKKLYKNFTDNHTVIDLSVDTGASSKAKKEQKSVLLSLIQQKLTEAQKKMAPNVVEQFLERIGFFPVAVIMELEKLILYVDEKADITLEDLNDLVGRTKQEALFELTSALTEGKLQSAITIAARLLNNGYHPLALVATLRNTIRSLLLVKALQQQKKYGYSTSMSPQVFQSSCLPKLKENEQWKKELSGHPYAVYMQFKTASIYSLENLTGWMALLLDAEMKLKSSPLPDQEILNHLFFCMIPGKDGSRAITNVP